MPELQEKLSRLFEQRLAAGQADLETLPNGDVCGHVISSEFEGRDYGDRRARIRQMLNDAVAQGDLSRGELSKVSTLLTYTPDEWAVAITDIQ